MQNVDTGLPAQYVAVKTPRLFFSQFVLFTTRCYAECGYAAVCLSVRPSVTFRYRTVIT